MSRFSPGVALVLLLPLAWLAPRMAHATTTLRIGTVAPEGSRYMKDIRAVGDEIERLSGGKIVFKWYPAGRLGDEKAMAAQVQGDQGGLDGAGFTGVGLPWLVPEMRVWVFPGLFQSYDEVDFLEKRYRKEYDGYFEKRGLVVVAWADVGFTYLHGEREIATFEALQQSRVWFWTDDESSGEAMRLVGVSVAMTGLAELAGWLADKKLDAWAFPPLAVIAFQLQRYSKYMADMPLTFLAGAFVLRKDVFDGLPRDVQRAIRAVGKKWESRIIKVWRAENDRAIAALEKQGTRIVRWSDAERQKFFQATAAQRGEFARKWGLEALMRRMSEDLQGFREAKR